jgi:hypothetical protein
MPLQLDSERATTAHRADSGVRAWEHKLEHSHANKHRCGDLCALSPLLLLPLLLLQLLTSVESMLAQHCAKGRTRARNA